MPVFLFMKRKYALWSSIFQTWSCTGVPGRSGLLIREALEANGGSMAKAARSLQVERSLLYKKMEKFGMK